MIVAVIDSAQVSTGLWRLQRVLESRAGEARLCSLSLYTTAHTPQAFCLLLHAGALQAIRAR